MLLGLLAGVMYVCILQVVKREAERVTQLAPVFGVSILRIDFIPALVPLRLATSLCDPTVVQKWSKSSSKVVQKLSQNGSEVVQKWSTSSPEVVQKWFKGNLKVIHNWSKSDPTTGPKVVQRVAQEWPIS